MYAKASVKVDVKCGECGKEGETSLPILWDERLCLATIGMTDNLWNEDKWEVYFKSSVYDDRELTVICPGCKKLEKARR